MDGRMDGQMDRQTDGWTYIFLRWKTGSDAHVDWLVRLQKALFH